MKYGTDRMLATFLFGMSAETETAAPGTETETEFPLDADTLLVVPVITGAVVVLLGSLFIAAASPAPGSLVFGAVASTMVGMVFVGIVGALALLAASFVAPWFGAPDPTP